MTRSLVVPVCFVALLSATSASAQTTTLTMGGFNGNMGNNTVAEFDLGVKNSATARTFTVAIATLNTSRTTSVYIRADAATMGGGKPVGSWAWRRNDLGTWYPLATIDVLIETRVIAGVGTSWSNSVFFRCNLAWASDAPLTYSVGVTFTLQVTP